MKRQRQHTQQHYQGNEKHENMIIPRYYNSDPMSPLSIPSCVCIDGPVENRQVVYPKKEHSSKGQYYYEPDAGTPPPPPPPPFERRDDYSGSSTIYTPPTPSPHRQQGHFPPPTSNEYSSGKDHESRRGTYSAGHYRDEPSRLRIEIPTSPQVLTNINNINNASSRPPLHNRFGRHITKSPNVVYAERERCQSQARRQILKEIVSSHLSSVVCASYVVH